MEEKEYLCEICYEEHNQKHSEMVSSIKNTLSD
jgi:hypothetical protein